MPRSLPATLALMGLLLVTGCSGGDGDDGAAPTSAASTSASAADTLVATGLEQLAAGDSATAKATFENVLEIDPGNVYAHYNLGLIAQDAGDDARAVKEYDAALETEPDFTSALYNKGIALETTDLDTSVELYRQALDLDPKLAAAHMRLGFALLHLGETDEAEEHLATGVKLDPSMAEVEAPTYG